MKILFVTSNRIGDAVLSTGLLDYLVHEYREADVTVACGPVVTPLFEAVGSVECVIPMPKRKWSQHWLDLWRQVVGTQWDIVVDLRASALSWMLRADKRYVLDTSKSTEPVHRVIQLSELLELDPPPSPRVWLTNDDREQAKALLSASEKVLGVGPTANWGGKQWPGERFAEAVERLTAPDGILPGVDIAVLGGPGPEEAAMAAPLLEALPTERTINLVGVTGLTVSAACLSQMEYFIGNDSGLMHLAAAVGVPTLGLFGPSREEHYAPWGRMCRTVRSEQSYEELTGADNYDYRKHDSHMSGLSVDRVVAAAEDHFSNLYAF